MVEFDLNIWLPTIMVSIIGIVVAAISYFARQNATTVGGTIRLESVQGDVSDVKSSMEKGFGDVKDLIEKTQVENRMEFREVAKRLEALEREGYNLRYRLDQVEKRVEKSGGSSSAV